MNIPDVIGFETNEAIREINKAGFLIDEIIVTKPVKVSEHTENSRVVRISTTDFNKVKLVVVYHDLMKGGV